MSKVTKMLKKPLTALVSAALVCSMAPALALADDSSGSCVRLSGDGRYDTMSAIVSEGFGNYNLGYAIIATGANFPDALAASSIAGVFTAPIILTDKDTLSLQARSQLERMNTRTVYVLGGMNSVSNDILTELSNMGIKYTRLGGSSRQATSEFVFRCVQNTSKASDTVIIASGKNYPDTLSISPYSYATSSSIVLTDNDGRLTDNAIDKIQADEKVSKVVIVGGENSVSSDVQSQLGDGYSYERLSGDDRYATSAAIANWEMGKGLNASNCALATGSNFPDALAGSALSGVKSGPVLLVDEGKTDNATEFLSNHQSDVERLYVYGGTNSVSDATVDTCKVAAQL